MIVSPYLQNILMKVTMEEDPVRRTNDVPLYIPNGILLSSLVVSKSIEWSQCVCVHVCTCVCVCVCVCTFEMILY